MVGLSEGVGRVIWVLRMLRAHRYPRMHSGGTFVVGIERDRKR